MPQDSYHYRRYLILNIINHLGPISRTELITLTDYRPANVGDIIKELLDEKLIVETGYASSGPGRKRIMLEMNKEHLCAVGISFSSQSVTYLVSQIDGKILFQEATDYEPDLCKEKTIALVVEHVKKILHMFCDRKILGIGISDPHYDPSNYKSIHTLLTNYTHFNDWLYKDLKPILEEISGVQVANYSGVAMPAIAEQRFGVAKGVQDFICVELSNGIGCSICCNGMPVVGASGRAAELGHTVISFGESADSMCYCGKQGCVEESTAFPALAAKISTALKKGVFSSLIMHMNEQQEITVQAIRSALEEGDKMCTYYVKDIAERLGVAISNAVNLLNPELIVFYGFMVELGDFFLQQLEISIRENSLSLVNDFEVRVSDSTETVYSLGAVAEIFSSYLMQENYKWIYQFDRNDLEEKSIKVNGLAEMGELL
ncbi:MAG: ROK family protein [Lachnospiraceae bacterium]|jgi:predicted NBD/HSP70 family sugar kinase|nr:ROK family protein [Lachnospiraceae bacterium]